MIMSLDYQQALDYIYSFVDFSRTHQENLSPENFDLSRMVRFMELLRSPQDEFPPCTLQAAREKDLSVLFVPPFCKRLDIR